MRQTGTVPLVTGERVALRRPDPWRPGCPLLQAALLLRVKGGQHEFVSGDERSHVAGMTIAVVIAILASVLLAMFGPFIRTLQRH
jgi:hypothetical protein